MRRRAVGKLIVLLAAASTIAACGSDSSSVPTVPVTPVLTTETFTGTLNIHGAVNRPFSTVTGGPVTATLTTLSPDSTIQVGLILGSWDGSACLNQINNTSATQGTVLSGSVGSASNLCVEIYDAGGTLPGPETFTITVVHP